MYLYILLVLTILLVAQARYMAQEIIVVILGLIQKTDHVMVGYLGLGNGNFTRLFTKVLELVKKHVLTTIGDVESVEC